MLLAIEAPWPAIAAATLLTGIGIELFSVLWDTSLQTHVPNEVLSRVSAWDAIGSLVLIPAAYAVVGPLADAIGIERRSGSAPASCSSRSRRSCSPARCESCRACRGPTRRR